MKSPLWGAEQAFADELQTSGTISGMGGYFQVQDLWTAGLGCDLGGAFVPFGLVGVLLAIRAIGKAAYFFGTVGGRTADVADPVCRFNVANRPLDVFVPDFLALTLAEPPHRDALNTRKA